MSKLRRCSRWIVAIAGCTLLTCAAPQVLAAESSDAFSRGVQAYAAGHRAEANALLAEAIRLDPHDPRPYYLRALCLARTSHPVEARADLVVAAALEARQPDRYPVEDALAELPVPDRTLLNQFRWRSQTEDLARLLDEGLLPFAARPTPVVRTDAGALRQKVSVPLGRLASSSSLSELASAAVAEPAARAVETGSDPFSDDAAASSPPDRAATPEAARDADPFAEPNSDQSADPLAARDSLTEPQDPFAPAEADSSEPAASGKIPSSKLFGIFRRVVARAAPVPSLDRVREQLPNLPLPGAANQPPAGDDPFGSSVEPAAFSEGEPFGAEPAAGDAVPPSTEGQPTPADTQQPAAMPEEDPFG